MAPAQDIIRDRKALILVPSFARGEKWADIAVASKAETLYPRP